MLRKPAVRRRVLRNDVNEPVSVRLYRAGEGSVGAGARGVGPDGGAGEEGLEELERRRGNAERTDGGPGLQGIVELFGDC